jgi:DNA-binding NarL/FixJ family response regulator
MKLPRLLAEIEEVIGRDATLRFAAVCGGTRVYVPAKASADHWIVNAIGPELAHKLCAYVTVNGRGIHLEIPLMPRERSHSAEIIRLTDRGLSAREIALTLKITTRTVHRNRSQSRQRGRAQ